MPVIFWYWAVSHAIFLTNHLFNLSTNNVPILHFYRELKIAHHDLIDFTCLPRFGCKAYRTLNKLEKCGKFDPQAQIGWFVGFQANTMKNALIISPHKTPQHPSTWKVFCTPHASFHENKYHSGGGLGFDLPATSEYDLVPPSMRPLPFISPPNNNPNHQKASENDEQPDHDVSESTGQLDQDKPENTDLNSPDAPDYHVDTSMTPFEPPVYAGQKRRHSLNHSPTSTSNELVLVEPSRTYELTRGEHEESYDTLMQPFYPPTYAGQKRIHSPSPPSSPLSSHVITQRGRRVQRHDYKRLHTGKAVAPCETYADPKSWIEAMTGPDADYWREAAEAEFASLVSTGTGTIIDWKEVPKNRTILTGKWVFKRKTHPDGSLEKYRARWTARGFTQQKGHDYFDTFAPTPRAETVKLLLALGHHLGWHRIQGDVPTAFLNPDLDVVMFIQLPQGFEQRGKVVKLGKGLYGLKQAAALWHDEVKSELRKQGLEPIESDVCLFSNQCKDLFVILHVDDFQILGPDTNKITKLTKALKIKFNFKIVTNDQFLGIQVSHEGNKLKLSQPRYARELLARHGLSDCKPANTPIERRMEPSSEPISPQRLTQYNQIVGGLQYLSIQTRPDIAFATNHLSRFLKNPSEEHLTSAKRVLRYISKDPDAGLIFTKDENPILEAYSDSDFAGDPSTARSTAGSLLRLGGPIFWRSHLQRDVVLSSTEAEYLALTETCRQVAWTRYVLDEIGLSKRIRGSQCTCVFVDNQAAISLTKNHDNHKRSRHVNVRNHYCRQQYHLGLIDVQYTPTNCQLADALTKPGSAVQII